MQSRCYRLSVPIPLPPPRTMEGEWWMGRSPDRRLPMDVHSWTESLYPQPLD